MAAPEGVASRPPAVDGLRRMRAEDVDQVMALYQLGHPTWPVRERAWYELIPGLVIEDGGRIVAWASFSLTLPPTPTLAEQGGDVWIAYLHDTVVAPTHRKQGHASRLLAARCELAADAGAVVAVGATWPSNTSMQKILRAAGFERKATAPHAFIWHAGEDQQAFVYTKSLVNVRVW